MQALFAVLDFAAVALATEPMLLVSPTTLSLGKDYSVLIQDLACLKDPAKAIF